MSPDGETIVTGAGDETLRFWNAFPSKKGEGEDRIIGNGAGMWLASGCRKGGKALWTTGD